MSSADTRVASIDDRIASSSSLNSRGAHEGAVPGSRARTRGVLYVHSSPRALSPHIEWAAGRVLGRAVNFEWSEQPILRGTQRAAFAWEGPIGTGAALASALRGWEHLRYEVTEQGTSLSDGSRFMHTPDLGIFTTQIDVAGNSVVNEERVRYAMEVAGADAVELHRELRLALGQAWDDELEPFRTGETEAPLIWLSRVG